MSNCHKYFLASVKETVLVKRCALALWMSLFFEVVLLSICQLKVHKVQKEKNPWRETLSTQLKAPLYDRKTCWCGRNKQPNTHLICTQAVTVQSNNPADRTFQNFFFPVRKTLSPACCGTSVSWFRLFRITMSKNEEISACSNRLQHTFCLTTWAFSQTPPLFFCKY